MPLLDRGNGEFAAAVTRNRWHHKSGRLDRLEAALRDVQEHRNDALKLRYLYKRLYRWIEENPNEFRERGSLAGQLAYQIELRAATLAVHVLPEAMAFRRATAAALLWTPVQDLAPHITAHNAEWQAIAITDQPTGIAGQYNFTAANIFAEADRNAAIAATGGEHPQNDPEYWLQLGRRVLTPQSDGHCYGRCFSCAAAVIYTLVMDPHFDSYTIEHVGSIDYDHHLVLLGRSNANGRDDTGLDAGREQWKWTAVVIDVWQENLNHTLNYSGVARLNNYAMSNLRWFCAYPAASRLEHRAFATRLVAPARVAARLDIAAAARAQVQNQGRATRNVKRGGKWVVEEEIADGVWQVV